MSSPESVLFSASFLVADQARARPAHRGPRRQVQTQRPKLGRKVVPCRRHGHVLSFSVASDVEPGFPEIRCYFAPGLERPVAEPGGPGERRRGT